MENERQQRRERATARERTCDRRFIWRRVAFGRTKCHLPQDMANSFYGCVLVHCVCMYVHWSMLLKNKCLCLSVSHARLTSLVLVWTTQSMSFSRRCTRVCTCMGARWTCERERNSCIWYVVFFFSLLCNQQQNRREQHSRYQPKLKMSDTNLRFVLTRCLELSSFLQFVMCLIE